jgi:lipopolysaccharide assembly outer membrane protein LptD (OstA)
MAHDSLGLDDIGLPDTLRLENEGSISEPIYFESSDSIHINLRTNKIRLKGESQMKTQGTELEAEVIILDMESKVLDAIGIEEENGNIVGFPRFRDDGDEYVGREIQYNYRTNRGLISMGETAMGEGFYYGEKIKRAGDNEFFIKNGYYTTCDAGHPHYYFGSGEMKMIMGEEFLLCPMTMYVEDMPVVTIPFGVFLPLESGRRSGLIIPTFDRSARRGLVFRDFGFYWAASEYYDTELTADWFTKGGFLLKNSNRWALRDVLNGSLDLEYGQTRFNPDDENTQNFRVSFSHNHEITPQDRFVANVSFSSRDFNRNTQFQLNNLIQQNIFSRASYNHSFDNGASLSLAFDRNQNIIDDSYSNNIPLTFNLPNNRIGRILDRDVNFSLTSRAVFSERKDAVSEQVDLGDTIVQFEDFDYSNQKAITFTPQISYALPKIWNFTITPQIGGGANVYFRRLEDREVDPLTGEFIDTYENGLFADYYANAGVRVQTRIFGVADNRTPFLGFIKPEMIGLKAFRHVLEPSFSIRADPDFSTETNNFYSTYIDREGNEIEYYRFQRDRIGTAPSNNLTLSSNWSLQNRFEAKIAGEEGREDTNMELLQMNLSGSYDFTRDSFQHSDIGVTLRTPALKFLNFNSNFNFSPYRQVQEYNALRDEVVWRTIDEYLFEGGGFARLTRASFNLSTSLSDKGFNYSPDNDPFAPAVPEDTLEQRQLGARFSNQNSEGRSPNYWGDSVPGHTPFNLPWALTLNMNYTVNRPNPDNITETFTLNAGANFTLAEEWRFRASANYDIVAGEIRTPNLAVTRDLHCWELTFNWVPTGPNQQFWLRFGIKSSQLADLFLEKRNNRQLR